MAPKINLKQIYAISSYVTDPPKIFATKKKKNVLFTQN